jgi:hypothetical protein
MPQELWFVRLEHPVHGADTIRLPDELVRDRSVYDGDARRLALAPLGSFVIYKGPDGGSWDRWFPAGEGLKTAQGLLSHYRGLIGSGPPTRYSRRELWEERLRRKMSPLEVLEPLLLEAGRLGSGFFIAERDTYHG